jgi:uncharacterized lipoprotein YehR (DUF1307 family)|tara:strand:- start:911 stop:1033 length:123 start_codon:yes stop_codon:yes gene_type:complete
MKKISVVFLVLIFLFALTSCGVHEECPGFGSNAKNLKVNA